MGSNKLMIILNAETVQKSYSPFQTLCVALSPSNVNESAHSERSVRGGCFIFFRATPSLNGRRPGLHIAVIP